MACGTVRSELSLVDVVIRMTAQAGDGQFDDAGWLLVAGSTGQGLVCAAQGKTGHYIVVEAALLPVAAIVAARALGAIAAFVDIILDVAGHTGP